MISHGYGVHFDAINTEDLEKLRLWRNNPMIHAWCRQNHLITDDDQKRWYSTLDKHSTRMYLIRSPLNVPVGVAGLTSIDPINSRAEFSLYIDPQSHKKGYGSSSLKTLLHEGFNTLNLNLVWGESFHGNPACKLFESLGFKHDGTRRDFYYKNGRYINAHLFSMTKLEFKAAPWLISS